MEWKDCKEEILLSTKEVGGEWRGLRSVNMKKDSRNEKVKKRDEDGEKKESSIYMREVLNEDVVVACEEMRLWISRG